MIMVEYDRSRPSHYQTQPRDSHFQHLDHHSAPSTPSPPYNYAHLPVRSTPTSYPSPQGYPSPSMATSYYPPQQQTHHSPHSQPMNGSSYSLPPIRMTPPNPPLPPPIIPQQSGSPLPHPPQIFYSHGPPHNLTAPPISHHITSSPQPPLRYPLPQVTPERIMSGGRHKKEIKRRTKTGCLTCRKRRIKCDEAHPTCKNCAKSKRECMGYDPIFKTQPGPAAIQPAPAGGAAIPPSASVPYGAPTAAVGGLVYTTAGSSPASSCEPYEYPVDPLLEATSALPLNAGPMVPLADTTVAYRPDLKRTYDRASPLSCISDTSRPSTTPIGRSVTPNPPLGRDATNPAKRIKIDDLLTGASNGLPLTPPAGDQSMQPLSIPNPITLYRRSYAVALDEALETRWFQTKGLERVTRPGQFRDVFGELLARFQSRHGPYIDEEDPSLGKYRGDAAVLMESVKLVYGTRAPTGDNRQPTEQHEEEYATPSDIASRNETINRIAIVEALLTGGTENIDLSSPQISPKSSPPQLGHPSSAFWRHLADFVSLKEGSDSENHFEAALKGMKSNRGNNRVRLVLCMIAEARHHYNKLHLTTRVLEERMKLHNSFEEEKKAILVEAQQCGSAVDHFIRRISSRALMLWGLPSLDDTFVL